MTSNQIAAEANAIKLQELEESKRHNIEQEGIEKDKLRIDEAYKTRMADIERQKNSLTEELGKLNIEWQSANESRKREIETRQADINQELANLKQFEANVDQEYKVGVITTKNLEVGENVRANKAREAIQEKANSIKEHEVDITERSEMGQTPKSRAQIISAAGSVKSPVGLATLTMFYGSEAYQSGSMNPKSQSKSQITDGASHSSGKF